MRKVVTKMCAMVLAMLDLDDLTHKSLSEMSFDKLLHWFDYRIRCVMRFGILLEVLKTEPVSKIRTLLHKFIFEALHFAARKCHPGLIKTIICIGECGS
jgi:hypothetical protein